MIILFWLAVVFGLFLWAGTARRLRDKIHAQRVWTQSIEHSLAAVLPKAGDGVNQLTNDISLRRSIPQLDLPINAAGQFVDGWKNPLRIESAGSTNFLIRSAGPNGTFGDADDIVFDSAVNDQP